MRLISMEKGGNLSSVYARLVTAVTEVGKKVKFSRHPRFGYLTFCPTNLGTTIRASVHARLPKLSADYARFEEIAGMYNLQVRIEIGSTSLLIQTPPSRSQDEHIPLIPASTDPLAYNCFFRCYKYRSNAFCGNIFLYWGRVGEYRSVKYLEYIWFCSMQIFFCAVLQSQFNQLICSNSELFC